MIRSALALAALAASAGCSGGGIDRERVCSVTQSGAYSPVPEGEAAWNWPAAIADEVERTGWTVADQALVESCGAGGQPPVVRLAFSADRRLALITRSSFVRSGASEPAPPPDPALEVYGSIETCLLRRQKVLESDLWQPLACKLDAVS